MRTRGKKPASASVVGIDVQDGCISFEAAPGELEQPQRVGAADVDHVVCCFSDADFAEGGAALKAPGIWARVLEQRAALGRPLAADDLRQLLANRGDDRDR